MNTDRTDKKEKGGSPSLPDLRFSVFICGRHCANPRESLVGNN